MSEPRNQQCRAAQEDIWSSWPDVSAVPPGALEHAASCPECAKELKVLAGLCVKSNAAPGKPLAWKAILEPRWRRLGSRTRAGIKEPTAPVRWVWAPGLAIAAAALALWIVQPPRTPEPAVPEELVENLEFFENLELFEDWDEVALLEALGRAEP
ncbi:MAG: hypothetical protein HY924_00135 [Elusimicrobia bacterium]|nr:hypothetical protein [Elusimicrobiota bacterium]